jgi:hypothetical protein
VRHAHGGDNFRIPVRGLGDLDARGRRTCGGFDGTASENFGTQCKGNQDERAHRCCNADQGMKQETDSEIERHPGKVEKAQRTTARKEISNLIQVTQGL